VREELAEGRRERGVGGGERAARRERTEGWVEGNYSLLFIYGWIRRSSRHRAAKIESWCIMPALWDEIAAHALTPR
jgi:hypothetical protein